MILAGVIDGDELATKWCDEEVGLLKGRGKMVWPCEAGLGLCN